MARRERSPRPPGPPGKGTGKRKLRRGLGNRAGTAKVRAADEAANAERKKRRAKVFELILRGHSYAQTAIEVGVHSNQVIADFKRALAEYGTSDAAIHRQKANARFDNQLRQLADANAMLRPLVFRTRREVVDGVEQRVPDPDVKAQRAYTLNLATQSHIVMRQARMNGAVAPLRVELEGGVGEPAEVSLDEVLAVARENSRPVLEAHYEVFEPDGTRVPSTGATP